MVEESKNLTTTTNDEFDRQHGIVNTETPKDTQLSGRFKKSFAYYTLRTRLPNTLNVLLTHLDESLKDNQDVMDLKVVKNSILLLKTQLENNETLEAFSENEPDVETWNNFLLNCIPQAERSFYKTCWLYSECYLYRRLYSIFRQSNSLKNFDYFSAQKLKALKASDQVVVQIVNNMKSTECDEKTFVNMLKLNLWGNRCDLSITSGKEVKPEHNLFEHIEHFNGNILADDSSRIWNCLTAKTSPKKVVDIVCDNAGFELCTDIFLAYYMVQHKLADTVRFHVKAMPWFISDTTPQDVEITLNFFKTHTSENLKNFGQECLKNFEEGIFQLMNKEYFWTTPYEYYRMPDINPCLYEELQKSSLVIFKGDLNYRKLLGDFNWDSTEAFEKCLRGFKPTSLCTLRTVKGDLICGLPRGLAEKMDLKYTKEWMFTGEFGIIQFVE